jgi:NAD(P)H-nitrite reductase large subunit
MQPDDHVCLCYRVSLRKLVNYMNRERPSVASQLSECLGAGTGCHWCVPFLERLHRQWENGEEPTLPVVPEQYAERRLAYHRSGTRED